MAGDIIVNPTNGQAITAFEEDLAELVRNFCNIAGMETSRGIARNIRAGLSRQGYGIIVPAPSETSTAREAKGR